MNSILLIDDDDFTAVFLESILGSNYSIQHAANGRDGLAVALAVPPTLILLDVEMPMMDGYEVCRHLKASGQTSEIPVIFLSAHVEIPDRLAGYEAGGDDYMTKPFDPDELATKIEVVLRNRSRNLELTRNAQLAAQTALSTVGDISIVLNFFREIISCSDLSQLASATLQVFKTFGLDVAVQLRDSTGSISRNHDGVCSPLEEAVLHNMASYPGIFALGTRSAFTFDRCSIIVKNMPRNDPERYGRVKDSASMIAESVDMCMKSLDEFLNAVGRGDKLLRVLHQITKALHDFENRYRTQRQASAAILDHLADAVEDSFLYLGLTDAQEAHLQKITRDAVTEAQALYSDAEQTDALMASIGENLGDVLQQELQGAVDAAEGGNRVEVW